MSLPPILKYIYNNAADESIRRGKRIFHTSGAYLSEHDSLTEQAVFRVKNDVYANHYKVTILNYLQPGKISTRCQCPYNMGNICRHEAAALFQLHDLLQSGFFDNVQINYDQEHTVVRMKQITTHFLKLFSSADLFNKAKTWVDMGYISIIEAKDDTVKLKVKSNENKAEYPVILKQNEERYFDTKCTCDETKYPLCIHKAASFLYILNNFGTHYFSTLRNWDTQKNKLLSLYGYTLNDDLTGKFEFSYHEGKPFLRVLDSSIKKISFNHNEHKPENKPLNIERQNKRLGIIVSKNDKVFPYVDFELSSGELDNSGKSFKGSIEKLQLSQYISPAMLTDRERILISAIRKQTNAELLKSIKRNSPFGDLIDHLDIDLHKSDSDLQKQGWEFYLPKYQRLLSQFKELPLVFYLPENKRLSSENLKSIAFSEDNFHLQLKVYPGSKGDTIVEIMYKIGTEIFSAKDIELLSPALLIKNNTLHCTTQYEFIELINFFGNESQKKIHAEAWPEYLEKELIPISKTIEVAFDESIRHSIENAEPTLRLYLRETDKMMVFKPVFVYNGEEKFWLEYTSAIAAENGKVFVIERNVPQEQSFLNMLRYFHPAMQESRKNAAFLLPAEEALKGRWYFSFMEKLRDENVEVIGYETLKQLRINPNPPTTKLQMKSGIDWFDVELNISFGDENVNINDVKKALNAKKTFVSLKDGSVGLLPEDWMEKYALMIKLGKLENPNTLRLKKYHFSVIEHLAAESGNDEQLIDLSKKKENLLNYDFDSYTQVHIPSNLNADLRPYQKSGFQWMSFLNDTGWGGILADDMGLGKTIQTLSFLQHYLNHNPDALFLVVCPTTLIYNWQNEIEKFTEGIKYAIHHGPQRQSNIAWFNEQNLIITTYGTLRSDIKLLSSLNFDYVILDESQAIKNPLSQVARSSMLLQSKNRLALSGTPVQNNTFDLYAQMNFLNPGMLGTMEFFRNEFANPIDKMQEEEAKSHLRKLIAPFLLRRTKEQVAPDLPEKTETVLYCEMGAKQRKIYDTYRNNFRSQILGKIEEKGIDRSRMSILTGLMKLRQICDSPAILNEDKVYENHSVKIEELVRELTENTGNHKSLVFSQFLGMLALIRAELEKMNIPYVYFDGSTNSGDREKAIQLFQKDNNCRVFLISLKAGGVGLNLTAADYVYIVDPWWNPAVEQQAIDRTHRIGQTKNIFAYRLICKNTIEEKILQLQERKINLARDLISEENAFLKKLTKEDVAYLLS